MRDLDDEAEVTLGELVAVVYAERRLVAASTILMMAIAFLVAFMMPNIYRSSALVAPASPDNSALSGALGSYRGLASMAGISLPSSESVSKTDLAIEILQSRQFLADFVERRGLQPELLAVDHWDEASGALVFDLEKFNPDTETLRTKTIDGEIIRPASRHENYSALLDLIVINENTQTSMINISVDHKSPIIAQELVTWLIEDLNDRLRQRDITEAKLAVKFLREQLLETTMPDLRQILFGLIESQLQVVTLAKAKPEYAFTVVDPAVIAEEKVDPDRVLFTILGGLIGMALAVFGVIVVHWIKTSLRPTLRNSASA